MKFFNKYLGLIVLGGCIQSLHSADVGPSIIQNPTTTNPSSTSTKVNESPLPGVKSAASTTTPAASTTTQTTPQASLTAPAQVTTKTEPPKVPERAQEILNFWFGTLTGPDSFPLSKVDLWLGTTSEDQRELLDHFSKDVENARRGDYNSWRDTPQGRLALILLLDQIPRIIFNNSPQAFSSDAMARGLVLEGVQTGEDKALYPIQRAFFYFPLIHSESLSYQQLAVRLYNNLYNDSSDIMKPNIDVFRNFALSNYDVIKRFGRFPFRNGALQRVSTPEENIYLSQPR